MGQYPDEFIGDEIESHDDPSILKEQGIYAESHSARRQQSCSMLSLHHAVHANPLSLSLQNVELPSPYAGADFF